MDRMAVTPRDALAAHGHGASDGHHARSVADLTFDEFLAEATRRRKLRSAALQKRSGVLGESRNSDEVNALLQEYHDFCRRKRAGTRSIGGQCSGNNKRMKRINCAIPVDGTMGNKWTYAEHCGEGQVCTARALMAYNFVRTNNRKVQWPTCVDEVHVDQPAEEPADEPAGSSEAGYSGYYWAGDNIQSPGTRDYILAQASNLAGGGYGRTHFHDTAGNKGWAWKTWSCFSCPPGRVEIFAHKPGSVYGFVF
ncbi:uncharacterized protein UV8b_00717 [Ustilaginoidea virens]|uniref:Secreted in xylem 1 protein n=1 Tax=Ustilaginoidea virens TaxID=1159556 RepID=A0A8E5MEL1_USTVR|nr:uncharacterized protein UV8b_00717 [Ustilaginoidea virens]QUC16476.1 hypothetical protein UV8b_00717 [Ustilaginoidea virens]